MIYTLSLHDALPILLADHRPHRDRGLARAAALGLSDGAGPADAAAETTFSGPGGGGYIAGMGRKNVEDRKSTRLNSSHSSISYAVFCLKKKKKKQHIPV